MGAHVGGAAQGGEHRQGGFEVFGLAADHDGQGSGLCADGAAGNRRIQVAHAALGQASGVIARFARLDGGHVDHQRAARMPWMALSWPMPNSTSATIWPFSSMLMT